MPRSSHLSTTSRDAKKLHIWVFHDGKPGHINQLEGLTSRLAAQTECDIAWLDATKHKLHIKNMFSLPITLKNLSQPDIILGAGHHTHINVLIAGFKLKTFTCLIMRPSLPRNLFNAVICPKHDGLQDSKKVLSTYGPLNKVTPESSSSKPSDKSLNIMLIGGASKHFIFETSSLISNIQQICSSDTNKVWRLSDSARTPIDFIPTIKKLSIPNLELYSYKDGNFGELHEILTQSAFTWVTPDSMSMVYESLTAGSTTAIFNMKPRQTYKPSRIAKQIAELVHEKILIDFAYWQTQTYTKEKQLTTNTPIIWEADRAARWLIQRLMETSNSEPA